MPAFYLIFFIYKMDNIYYNNSYIFVFESIELQDKIKKPGAGHGCF